MQTQPNESWSLDGVALEDFATFLRENAEDFTVEEALRFVAMEPGEQIILGGGAGAEFVLARVS